MKNIIMGLEDIPCVTYRNFDKKNYLGFYNVTYVYNNMIQVAMTGRFFHQVFDQRGYLSSVKIFPLILHYDVS